MYPATMETGLQAICAGATATSGMLVPPHHPITCYKDWLVLHPDGSMECPHALAPAGDARTQAAVNHSVAILLFELVSRL